MLEQCEKYLAADGTARDLTPAVRDEMRAQIAAAAGEAMRTLAFAHAELPPTSRTNEDAIHARRGEIERGLVFAGFVAIRDPLRDDVKDAVRQCRDAGIEVKMITGDTFETARAIGREIGLLDATDAIVMTHDEFDALSDEELMAKLPKLRILARARPRDKYRMVTLLQEQDEVVAVTGDGTNDAPALKKADVGLAMGIAGTEVAKEASKIVLLDDAFCTIVEASTGAASLYENIQRFIQFQLTINVTALVDRVPRAVPRREAAVHGAATAVDQRHHGHVRGDRAVLRAAARGPDAAAAEAPRREHPHAARCSATSSSRRHSSSSSCSRCSSACSTTAGSRATGRRSDEFPTDLPAGDDLLHGLRVLPGVEPDQLPVAVAATKRACTGSSRTRSSWSIASLTVVGQVLIVTLGGKVFNVEPLGAIDWLVIAVATSSVLVFAEIARRVRMADWPRTK